MKNLLLTGIICLAGGLAQAANLDIVPDKFAEYKVGETVTFTATAWESKDKKLTSGTYSLTVRDSGGKIIGKPLKVDVAKNNPVTLTTKLDRPGFILVQASTLITADKKAVRWANKPVAPLGGAAVEPGKIKAGAEPPKDFAEFWQKGIEKYKNAEVIITPAADIKYPRCKVSRVLMPFADGSGAIDGFLAVPLKPGKYPIVFGVPGAGPGNIAPGAAYAPAKAVIRLWMNVHNFRTAKTIAEQKKLYAAYNNSFATKLYFRENAQYPEKYIYYHVWLSVSRALDKVAEMPEFDGKNVAAVGSSQGGGSALALAYLNKKVTCVVSNVPALCDHDGWRAGRQAGWPQLHAALKGKADKSMPYFDGANFARGIKVPVLMSVGYIDTTCSPSSCYAAFNNLAGEKTMYHMYRGGHIQEKPFGKKAAAFLMDKLSK